MPLSSFREHQSDRTGHLLWRSGDIHLLLGEDSSGFYSHLPHENKYTSYFDDHHDEILTPEDEEHFYRHLDSLDPEHHHMLHTYKADSEHLNHPLRTGLIHQGKLLVTKVMPTNPDSARNQEQTLRKYQHLDELTSGTVPRDMTVYRGMTHDSGIHKIPVGGHFIDRGYTGTSLKKSVANSYSGVHNNHDPWYKNGDARVPPALDHHYMIAKIHVPAGSAGHYMDLENGPSPFKHENELLLKRGTKFQILGHERVHHDPRLFPGSTPMGVHMIHMRVVGNHPHELITHHQLGYDPDDE